MSDYAAARSIVVLADCHIHPADGIAWPPAALAAFAGADLIITLGDMGEASGLAALAAIAPVVGVRGADDEDNPYASGKARRVEAGGLAIGCVFDPLATGVATAANPLTLAPEAALKGIFGAMPDVLLWASTHVPSIERVRGRLVVNPGSATLPDKGAAASYARLTIVDGAADAAIVTLAS
jgi:putative phosphoesterase